VVLGHEGAGEVVEVGAGVSKVKVGDHVILSTLGNCGQCDACDRGQATHCRSMAGRMEMPFTVGGTPAFQFANLGCFSDYTVVHETQAVVIPKEVPMDVACLIGCGVATGTGAAVNRAKVEVGTTCVVIGCGGIGLSVIQGCRLRGAGRIIAVDINPRKKDIALKVGATEFLDNSGISDLPAAIRDLGAPNGVDYSFEAVGDVQLIRDCIDMLDWGGSAVMIGVPGMGSEGSFNVQSMYHNKSIMGCRYGAARPHHDFPLYARLYMNGQLLLDEMVTQTYPLADIEKAIEDQHDGKLARGVLVLD
jgi:S-(hydroxymethyl)glutathione dehydrogenase/alcohol dehydrogenase